MSHLHGSGVGFESFGAGQRGDGGSEFAQCGLGQLLDGDDFDVVGGGEAAAEAGDAAGGEDVIRAGGIVSGGFGTERADEDAAGVTDFGKSDSSGMLRCSGAKRLESSTASSRERTMMMALFLSIALAATAAVGSVRSWRSTSLATAWARRLDVVSRMALASTSCSAWASMSAAK